MKILAAWPMVLIASWFVSASHGAEPITVKTVELPADIAPDEPRAGAFSLERAAHCLDTAALDWQRTHACTSCHTMFPYLMCRPALNTVLPQSGEVRQFFEEIVALKREAMPSYSCHDVEGAVAVGIASAMAINDRTTTGKLHPLSRTALERMWSLQRPDGGWEWPYRDTPPIKINEHYGVTLAAIGAGMAPDDYASTPTAAAGLDGIRKFLRRTKAVGLHQKAMLLWASAYVDGLLSADAKAETARSLMSVQRPDGGWSMANLVDNTDDPSLRESDRTITAKSRPGYGTEFLVYVGRDEVYKSSLASDGYATGFVIFVVRQAGLPAGDERLQRGIAWLKSNQRESGRWFTPSQSWHRQHLISNAGTGYAVLALQACGEVSPPRQADVEGRKGSAKPR